MACGTETETLNQTADVLFTDIHGNDRGLFQNPKEPPRSIPASSSLNFIAKGITTLAGVAVLIALVVVVGGAFVFVLSTTGNSTSTSTSSALSSSTSFAVKNVALETPQDQSPCQGLLCQSSAEVLGTVTVGGNSPLSCIDVSLNGTSAGSSCWNLTSPYFTSVQCNGSGANSSCTTVSTQNTNSETNRTFPFNYLIQGGGGDGIPNIVSGHTYLVSLVAQFEGGSNSTMSATVVAVASSNFSVSTVSGTVSSTTAA